GPASAPVRLNGDVGTAPQLLRIYAWSMFPYDATLLTAVQSAPQSISDVIQTLHTIGTTCVDADGLKWFNWLYLQVTQAVEARVAAGEFTDPAWRGPLDVQFARLSFSPPASP